MRPALLALLVAAVASADGRSPLTTGVTFRPGDAQAIYIRSTIGLMISHDDGCSFRWVCERAIGYGGDFDPKYAVGSDGTIFATTYAGLRMTRDGCTWTTAPVGPGKIWVDAIDIGPSGQVWVATAESAGANDVYRSTDNGATFEAQGMQSSNVWWKSVEVAPSNARTVYVTGYQVAPTPRARLYRTDDAGERWTERALAVAFGATPIVLVAAIDPTDRNSLLLTSLEANPPRGDRLYRSTDGGATFAEVLATTDRLRDVVFAADGSVYAVTLGGGAFRSTDRGATFSPLANPPQLGCLGQRSDGDLIGCGANWEPDNMAVVRTRDAARWDKVFRFADLVGPLQCAASTTVGQHCGPKWPSTQALFGATGTTSCPILVDGAPAIPAPRRSGGCCDAGRTDGLPLAAVVALRLRRRRHRPSRQLR